MNDPCFMEVVCRRIDFERFRKLGFDEFTDPEDLCAYEGRPDLIRVEDPNAPVAHNGDMPADIPYFGYHGAGCEYDDMAYACDGAEYAEAERTAGGELMAAVDDSGNVIAASLARVRNYLHVLARARQALGLPADYRDG